MLPSIVMEGATLRRLAFPPILIPLSASVTVGITFCVNLPAFAVFVAVSEASRRRSSGCWSFPLLVELYLFTVGLGPAAQRALRALP